MSAHDFFAIMGEFTALCLFFLIAILGSVVIEWRKVKCQLRHPTARAALERSRARRAQAEIVTVPQAPKRTMIDGEARGWIS